MSGAHKNRAARDPRQSAEWVGLLRFAFRIAGMAGLLVACVGLVLVDPAPSREASNIRNRGIFRRGNMGVSGGCWPGSFGGHFRSGIAGILRCR
jgi:hypothetical protein